MDILIYCNGLNTRIYLNAKIENENEKILLLFMVIIKKQFLIKVFIVIP